MLVPVVELKRVVVMCMEQMEASVATNQRTQSMLLWCANKSGQKRYKTRCVLGAVAQLYFVEVETKIHVKSMVRMALTKTIDLLLKKWKECESNVKDNNWLNSEQRVLTAHRARIPRE